VILFLAALAVLAVAGCGREDEKPASGVTGIVVAVPGGRMAAPLPSPSPVAGFVLSGGVKPAEHARVIVWTALSEHRRGEVVGRTWSKADGLFRAHLEPGPYIIGIKRDPSSWEHVVVKPDHYTRLMVTLGRNRFGPRVSECPTSASSRTPEGLQ
jgi:hypothetical protein